ncbi:hypothetical protein FRC02_012458 [Tulasnella sp. 418]|nr:hypothetical protein FRC02_012458 [Tulasnella sp. 418]
MSRTASTDSATKVESHPDHVFTPPSRPGDVALNGGQEQRQQQLPRHSARGLDVAYELMKGQHDDSPIPEKDAKRLRKKLDWHLLPLLFLLHGVQFMEKSSLSFCAVLGIIEDNKLSTKQFNDLGTAYYIGFILFQWPHSWAFQRLPVAKYVAANILLWSLLSGLHCVTPKYGGLFAIRLILGASEGCVSPGVMILIAMFYNRVEIGQRINWTIQCNGLAGVAGALVAFGVYFISPNVAINAWRAYMLIISGLCLITGVLFLLFFPDNPTTAKFLTNEERVMAIRRIQENQTGIETKKWKKEQFKEALVDPKTWLFFVFAAVSNIQGGVALQMSLLIKGFRFTVPQTTLLNIPPSIVATLAVSLAGFILKYTPNGRSWVAIGYTPFPILGCLLLLVLPLTSKGPQLFGLYLTYLGLPVFTSVVGWVVVTTSGHTKRLTVNAIFQIGYSIGQAVGPQIWQAKFRPRNAIPYAIVLASFVADAIIIFFIRLYLQNENRKRDRANEDKDDFTFVEKVRQDGTIEREKVSKTLLDLTDRDNKAFRYAL